MGDKRDATALSGLMIDEISLVDDPANPLAKAVIIKAKKGGMPCADCKTPKECKAKGGCANDEPDGDEMKKSLQAVRDAIGEFAPAIIKHLGETAGDEAAALGAAILKEREMDLEELTKALEGATATIEAQTAEITKLKAERDEAVTKAKEKAKEKGEEKSEDELLKNVPESIRKRLADAEKASSDAKEAIEKMRDERELNERIAKAKADGIHEADKVGAILHRVTKGKATAEDTAEIERLLKAAAAQDKTSELYKARGSSVAVEGDPEAILKAKAAEIRKGKPELSDAVAYDMALQQNPAVYAELKKRRGA